MKVLVLSPSRFEKGGISTVVNNLQSNLSNSSLEFNFYSTWKNGNRLYRVVYCTLKLLIFPLYLLNKPFDVIYIHFAHNGSFFRKSIYSLISRVFKKKIIWHSHSSSFDIFYEELGRKKQKMVQRVFLEYCDSLIVLGVFWKEFYEKTIHVNKKKITILHNAVLVPNKPKYDVKSKIITMFGRLGKRKGTFDLLAIAEHFKEKDIVFRLYGDGDLKLVSEIIQEKNLSNVEIKGWIDHDKKWKEMEQAILNILPSYNEGLPMAILETMALGIPNIATNVGSINEVILDGSNGFLVKAGDIEGMISVIEMFTSSKSILEKNKMSILARETVLQHFSIDEYFKKLNEILLGKGY